MHLLVKDNKTHFPFVTALKEVLEHRSRFNGNGAEEHKSSFASLVKAKAKSLLEQLEFQIEELKGLVLSAGGSLTMRISSLINKQWKIAHSLCGKMFAVIPA